MNLRLRTFSVPQLSEANLIYLCVSRYDVMCGTQSVLTNAWRTDAESLYMAAQGQGCVGFTGSCISHALLI